MNNSIKQLRKEDTQNREAFHIFFELTKDLGRPRANRVRVQQPRLEKGYSLFKRRHDRFIQDGEGVEIGR